MKITEVTSLELPELEPYRTLKRPLEHQKEGIFVAEGTKVVQRLLDSPLEILSILLTPEWFQLLEPVITRRRDSPVVYVASKKLVETIVGFNLHQGIMAVAKIPRPSRIDDLLAKARKPYFLAAVDGLTNAENLGVLVRNCAAFGVQAILVGETSSSPYLRRAVRNSMGTIFSLPVVEVDSLASAIGSMRSLHGVKSFAAHPRGETALGDADLTESCCFVFGNEGEGISKKILQACDAAIGIPMANGVDSLNVATASAVFFFETARQRKRG